jgi:hypothetical protein
MVGHHHRVHAGVGGRPGILGIENAFQHHRAFPVVADPGQVVPGDGRIELRVHPVSKVVGRVASGNRIGEVAKRVGPALDTHLPHPAWVADPIESPNGRTHGRDPAAQAVSSVAVAGAHHRKVRRQYQHATPHRLGTGHQILCVAAVPHDVQLKPRRPLGRSGHLLQRADRHGGLHEAHTCVFGRSSRRHLGPVGKHARQPHRGQKHRQAQLLAQHRGAHRSGGHVAQHPLTQRDRLQVGGVGRQRRLLVGTPVDVVEQLSWQPSTRHLPIIANRSGGQPQRSISAQRVQGHHGLSLAHRHPAPLHLASPHLTRPRRRPSPVPSSG